MDSVITNQTGSNLLLGDDLQTDLQIHQLPAADNPQRVLQIQHHPLLQHRESPAGSRLQSHPTQRHDRHHRTALRRSERHPVSITPENAN